MVDLAAHLRQKVRHDRTELTMAKYRLIAAVFSVLSVPTLAGSPADDCTVLEAAFRQARTEFPALKNKQFGGALCRYKKYEFTCEWGFSSDKFGEAEDQIARLERCTAAQPKATLLEKKHQKATFELNPETKVIIRGPDPNAGDWAIQLKIISSANWD